MKNYLILTICFSLALLMFTESSEAYQVVWNYANRTDFYNTNPSPDEHGNDNVWYYQYGPLNSSDSSTYTNMAYKLTQGWKYSSSTSDWYPDVWMNSFHAGPSNDSIIGFRAPLSGEYSIHLVISHLYDYGDGQKIYIQKNSTILAEQINLVGESHTFDLDVTLDSDDDYIYIRLNKYLSSHGYDRVTISDLTITGTFADPIVIPEPVSCILLASALMSAVGLKSLK